MVSMTLKEIENIQSSIETKREKSRKEIMAASLELFYEKGYQKTTTRDIIKKAGILNGSLYNRFKSKEEIILSIVIESLKRTLEECEKVLENEKNPLIAAVLPGALEVAISSQDRKSADLIYEVHRIWSAVEEYTKMNIEWFSKYMEKYGISFADTADAELKMYTFLGAIGNICGYYANGGTESCDKIFTYMIMYMGSLLGMPVLDIDRTVGKLKEIVMDSGMAILSGKPDCSKE